MVNWLDDVKRLEEERDERARAKADTNREIREGNSLWIREEVQPAMERFATELRSIGRIVEVTAGETVCRVEVRDRMGMVSEFTAEIGTDGEYSTEVKDRLPTMSEVFYGVQRKDVKGHRIYELLKLSYMSKIKSQGN